jgi:predicted benzoate:H+ symporter BenE
LAFQKTAHVIAALAGLAMLRVLQTGFTVAFMNRFTLGALVIMTFLVTVADVSIRSSLAGRPRNTLAPSAARSNMT